MIDTWAIFRDAMFVAFCLGIVYANCGCMEEGPVERYEEDAGHGRADIDAGEMGDLVEFDEHVAIEDLQ